MKDEVIRFIASISGNDVTFGIVRFKVVEHGMQCGTLIRLLSGLNDNIKKSLGNNIDEAVEVHVVIPPVVDHPRDVIVLDDHFVSGINDMASICGKDTVVLEFMGGLRERSRKFIEQVSESGQGYLVPALDESGLRRNPVVLHVKETDKFCASSTFSHGKDQAHGVGERKLAERLAHEIMAGIRGEKPVFI